jgi:hypothetical protein
MASLLGLRIATGAGRAIISAIARLPVISQRRRVRSPAFISRRPYRRSAVKLALILARYSWKLFSDHRPGAANLALALNSSQ